MPFFLQHQIFWLSGWIVKAMIRYWTWISCLCSLLSLAGWSFLSLLMDVSISLACLFCIADVWSVYVRMPCSEIPDVRWRFIAGIMLQNTAKRLHDSHFGECLGLQQQAAMKSQPGLPNSCSCVSKGDLEIKIVDWEFQVYMTYPTRQKNTNAFTLVS